MSLVSDERVEELLATEAKVGRLRDALIESFQDNLYNAIHCGVTGNGGKWWPGGMSDAEWFCRQAGIGYEPKFDKETLLARVPEIAKTMIEQLDADESR